MPSELVRPGYRGQYAAIVREKLVAAAPTSMDDAAYSIVGVTGNRIFAAPEFVELVADDLAANGYDDLAELVRQVEEADLREASARMTQAAVRSWPPPASIEVARFRARALRRAVTDMVRARDLRGEDISTTRVILEARPTRREPRARRTTRTSRGDPEPSEPDHVVGAGFPGRGRP